MLTTKAEKLIYLFLKFLNLSLIVIVGFFIHIKHWLLSLCIEFFHFCFSIKSIIKQFYGNYSLEENKISILINIS